LNIALLSEQILLQKAGISSDDAGNRVSSWKDYFSCYATVSAESPIEETSAGATWDESTVDFTLRWCSEVEALTSKEYRVIFRGEAYNIEGIDHMNYKKKAIKLHCRREEA
jgi:SPP1 family predicted phage head-tail adaptor